MQAFSSVDNFPDIGKMEKGGEGGCARIARLLLHAKPVLSTTRGQEENTAANFFGAFLLFLEGDVGGRGCRRCEQPKGRDKSGVLDTLRAKPALQKLTSLGRPDVAHTIRRNEMVVGRHWIDLAARQDMTVSVRILPLDRQHAV